MLVAGGNTFRADRLKPTAWRPEVTAYYSADLLALAWDCLEYLPDDRPTLDAVRARILTGIRTYGQGLRDAAVDGKQYIRTANRCSQSK